VDVRYKAEHDEGETVGHARGIQEIRIARQCRRPRHRRDHRRGVFIDREFAGRRCHHGGLDFSNHFIPLSSKVTADSLVEAKKQGAVIGWGSFLTVTLNFIIIAFILFLVIRGINKVAFKQAKAEEEKPAPLTKTEKLLTEIRDQLKAR
jgi:large conductance mechanosensitive channel protein